MTPGAQGDEPMVEINTTPLIDVLLVLLIMLIVTIPVQTHALKLDLPAAAAPATPPAVITIDIDFDGTVAWNGEPLAERAALDARLSDAAAATEQPEIRLRPNRLVEYGHVARVMASAQRAGLTKIGIVTRERAAR